MDSNMENEGGIVPIVTGGMPEKVGLSMIVAASAGSGIAHLGTSTMPFQIGALMGGLDLSASAAGIFGFCEIGALSLSMLLISPFIHRTRPVVVALSGAVLGILAHLALYYSSGSLALLYLFGSFAGAGYGLVFSAMVSGVAAFGNADRLYALANGGALIVIVALMAALPYTSSRFGPLGPFLGIAILLAITIPAYWGFRASPGLPAQHGHAPLMSNGAMPLLVIWTAFSLGTGAVWSFAERIGNSLNLTGGTVGFILSASTFCGLIGTAIAAASSGRVARIPALIVGLVGTAGACIVLGYAAGVVTYALGVLAYWIFYMFLYSYLLGSAAALDPSGRIGTAGGGCERMGFALGAPLGGLFVDHMSFSAVGILGAIGCVGLLPLCLPQLRKAFSDERHAPA